MAEDDDGHHWHLDRKVPIALIFAIIVQSCAAVWWISSTSSRIDHLEIAAKSYDTRIAALSSERDGMRERLISMEVTLKFIAESLLKIERRLDPQTEPPVRR